MPVQNNPRPAVQPLRQFLYRSTLLLAVMAGGLTGCGEKQSTSDAAPESEVLAQVNGENITREDVDFSLERTFSQLDLMTVDAALQQKVLDSLIASRAMKQLVVKEMDAQELERIKNLARAYEEELFVKEYLQRHITPQPVTAEMVQQYYQQHPEEFGGETLRDFELLKAPANLDDQQRDALLKKMPAIRATADWSTAAKAWEKEFALQYQQGRSKKGLLDKTLEQAIAALDQGATSEVFYLEGSLHLVRVKQVIQAPAKSLAEVSGDIRKRLAPLLLREAVKKASDEARAQVDVVIPATNKD